jgi:multiple sugar transport system permease protein
VPAGAAGTQVHPGLAFLLSWTDYTYALLMVSTDRLKTVPLGLATMMGAYDLRWGR